MAHTHYKKFVGRFISQTTDLLDPKLGDVYYDSDNNQLKRYDGTNWQTLDFNTTTSTSSSTTTTSTSTSTTTTSTSTTTSTTTSSSTSTSTTTTV